MIPTALVLLSLLVPAPGAAPLPHPTGLVDPVARSGPADRSHRPDPTGPAVVIGGGLSADNGAIWTAILDRRSGPGPICVIPAASADPQASARSAGERFRRWGGRASVETLELSTEAPERARDPEMVSRVEACGGFHFTGGVQSRITEVLAPDGRETPVLEAIRQRHAEGAVVAGSSAGAAIMTDPMISGGSSEGALETGTDGGVRLDPGLGFVPGAIMDQHFLARGRIGRLAVAVLEADDPVTGFGIDEDTALIVEAGGVLVVGASGVVVVSAEPGPGDPDGEPSSIRTVRIHLLGDGDRLDPATGQVTPAPGKRPIPGGAEPGEDEARGGPEDGIFQRWTFLHELHALAGGPGAPRHHEAAGHRIILERAAGFRAWARDGLEALEIPGGQGGTGPRGTPGGLGAGPVLLHMVSPADPEARDPAGITPREGA
ncbi:MAG: cyanophycinase [Gemmatimonadales bacterium]|nr:MAG: cyanophycinase [Gemmatimonadales bacterium]